MGHFMGTSDGYCMMGTSLTKGVVGKGWAWGLTQILFVEHEGTAFVFHKPL
jgi:hypothetical protein